MTKKKQTNFYEFTLRSNEPCISDINKPLDNEANRVIKIEERNLSFLVDYYNSLNLPAIRLMSELAAKVTHKHTGEKISRVGKEDPLFGKKWYLIKFVGSFGTSVKNLFFIQEEDENILHYNRAYKSVIPGNRYVIFSDQDSCPKCLSENVRFKIKPESKNIRCGVCLGLEGLKRTI